MDLNELNVLTEKLRSESIGDPIWIPEKQVFEYDKQTIEVAVVLKIIRASHGVNAMHKLCEDGLFIDMGVLFRCVLDCTSEVHFMLENYPTTSSNVSKFLKEFFSKTIDEYLASEHQHVETSKIHNAVVRFLSGKNQDETLKKALGKVYKTFSGYTHAGYSHIMQMYGGTPIDFNLSGISSNEQKSQHRQLVTQANLSVLHSIAHATKMFQLDKLNKDVISLIEAFDPTP